MDETEEKSVVCECELPSPKSYRASCERYRSNSRVSQLAGKHATPAPHFSAMSWYRQLTQNPASRGSAYRVEYLRVASVVRPLTTAKLQHHTLETFTGSLLARSDDIGKV